MSAVPIHCLVHAAEFFASNNVPRMSRQDSHDYETTTRSLLVGQRRCHTDSKCNVALVGDEVDGKTMLLRAFMLVTEAETAHTFKVFSPLPSRVELSRVPLMTVADMTTRCVDVQALHLIACSSRLATPT